ncbi:MAG: OsmC family protein [Chloroflexi bacterium]|nr:OsmC family protein [Chloroflexota bacterium]
MTTTEATLNWTGGTVFEAAGAGDATIQIDLPIEKGGTGRGFRPMELLLHALGTCLATTLVQILAKQRLTPERYRVTLRGDRAEERPNRYTHILVEHTLRGSGLTQANLERLVALVEERYCSVAATLPPGLVEQRVVIAPLDS